MNKLDTNVNTSNPQSRETETDRLKNFSSFLTQKQVYLEKYITDKIKTKIVRTNSEHDLLLQLNSLNFPKLVSTDLNETSGSLDFNGYDDASYYISKDETFSLPQIGSKFLFEEDQTTSEYNNRLMKLKSINRLKNDTTRTIKEAITFENDLKHLLKVSLHNKRILLIIEQHENDLNETSVMNEKQDKNSKLLTRKKPGNVNAQINLWPKDFPPHWRFEFMAAIKYSSFGQSNLIYSQAFKILDKRKYFFIKKIDLPNFKAKINNISDYRNFINNLRKFKTKEISHKYQLSHLKTQYKTLSHLNLMLVTDAHLTKDLKSLYILTDFAQNKNNLDTKIRYHRIKQIPIDANLILKWFYQTLSAIYYLHLNGILHANIKPSNFLLVSSDHIKLTDFGYLNLYFTILSEKSTYITKLAKNNVGYLPKESIMFNEYTEYSDLYSIGAVFYELLFLTPYDWSNELLKSNLRIGFRSEENFGLLLASMLSNEDTARPNSLISLDFFNWNRSFRILKTIIDEKGKRTQLVTSVTHKSRLFMRKQIKIRHELNKTQFAKFLDHLRQESKHHKNLSLFHDDFFIIDSHLFLITNFEVNGSLEEKIAEKRDNEQCFEEFFILKIQVQICDALKYLHSKHLIHGNLKTQNVLVNESNIVKLVDFGYNHVACKQSEESNKCPESNYSNETMNNNNRSTAINGMHGLTYKSDIYLLGLVLFKMVTLNEYDSHLEHLKSQYEYSDKLKNCITSMLHNEAESRIDLLQLMDSFKKMLGDTYFFVLTRTPKLILMEGKVRNLMSMDEFEMHEKSDNNINYFLITSFRKIRMQNKNSVKLKEVSARITVDLTEKNVHKNTKLNTSNQQLFQFEPLVEIPKEFTENTLHLKNIFHEASLVKGHNTPKHTSFTCALNFKLIDKLPKVLCFINKTHLIGVDSETIYLIDQHLKCIRTSSLYETLHLKVIKGQSNTMDIKVFSSVYDSKSNKFYLLISIKQQQCLLTIFDVNENNGLVFRNIFYMPLTPKGTKKLVCNSSHLILCEKNGLVRVFRKETGRFVQNLRTSDSKYAELHKEKLESLTRHDKVKDIYVDANDDIFIAFSYSIEVFNNKYKLKWKYVFGSGFGEMIGVGKNSQRLLSSNSSYSSLKSTSVKNLSIILNANSKKRDRQDEEDSNSSVILGKITHVCVGNNATIAIVTRDENSKVNSRCYIFTDF